MTTREFITKKLRGETSKEVCSSVYAPNYTTDGTTIYSYGYHYPLVKIIDGMAFVNNAGYSNTTAKHINWAWQAASDVVGYANTYQVPLTNGDSLTLRGIKSSATRELERLEQVMTSKKRKDTAVYSDLERQANNMRGVLTAVRELGGL